MERNLQAVNAFRDNPEAILALTQSHEQTVAWLRENNIIRGSFHCCGNECVIVQDRTRLDGEEFRCVFRSCRTRLSIREGTFLASFRRIPIVVLTRIVFFYFVQGTSANRVTRRLVRDGIQISRRTTARIYDTIREEIVTYMRRVVYSRVLIGNIEMDEALFTHRAGFGRRGNRQVWVVGMVERTSGHSLVFVVENRNSATINDLIRHNIAIGSRIITDGWRGYHRIPRAYRHINVLTNPGFTTSQVEGFWGQLRARIRAIYSSGVIEGNVNKFLQEILWRRNLDHAREDILPALIEILAN